MPVIWGHVASVVNQPKSSPSLMLSRSTTFETCRTECIVGMGVRTLKGFEPLSLDEIRSGDFVIGTITEHAGWLEAERIGLSSFDTIR
jgi:hypothetical protein